MLVGIVDKHAGGSQRVVKLDCPVDSPGFLVGPATSACVVEHLLTTDSEKIAKGVNAPWAKRRIEDHAAGRDTETIRRRRCTGFKATERY